MATDEVTLSRANRLSEMYVLSPFVWRVGKVHHILLRAVPRRDDDPRLKMAEIWHGVSTNGLHFEMDMAPLLFPGPDLADLDGCEDPTVLIERGVTRVWYTGYNHRERAGQMMLARGPDIARVAKVGSVIPSAPPDYANPKEATVVRRSEDSWRMFFEFARNGASRIGQVDGANLDDDWGAPADAPLRARPGQWDDWHLSPGPITGQGTAHPVMFYNGATRGAQWRIGWAIFDRSLDKVVARGEEPLITPLEQVGETETNIAFAASLVEAGSDILLYSSVSDQHLRRATIRRH